MAEEEAKAVGVDSTQAEEKPDTTGKAIGSSGKEAKNDEYAIAESGAANDGDEAPGENENGKS